MSSSVRLASWITAVNVLIASGFSIAGLIRPESILPPPGSVPTVASLIFALYAAARTVPLAVMALIAIYRRSIPMLLVLGALAGAIQILDGIIGVWQHDWGKSVGPFAIGVFQFYALFKLRKLASTAALRPLQRN
jgi:hypothetical protein